MLKKIIYGLFIAAIITGGIYWFIYVRNVTAPVSSGINAIPPNAIIILESRQTKNVWKKLSQTNIMWEQLISTRTFAQLNNTASYIDSLLTLNEDVSAALENHSLFISAHIAPPQTYNLLYVFSLPNLTYESSIEKFFKNINNNKALAETDYTGVKIKTLHATGKEDLHIAFLNGIVMMSASENLVQEAIRQQKSGISLAKNNYFSKIISTAGKNADATVYINYKTFPKLINLFAAPSAKLNADAIADFADCSGWDITVKPNALSLTGFTQANDSTNCFLNLFMKQKPQEIELTKVIPYNTSQFLYFGISNFTTYYHDYKKYLNVKKQSSAYDYVISSINNRYNINVVNMFLNWMNNEMALVITEPSSVDFTDNCYAVFRSNSIENASGSLRYLSKIICSEESLKTDTSTFRNHLITFLNLPDIIPHLFGEEFSRIRNNYFTSIDNYIVFANTKEALKQFITSYENHKTLEEDKNYRKFSENISTECNMYLYSSVPRSSYIYSTFLTNELSNDLEKNSTLLKKFEAAAIQFTAANKSFYSNIYLKYNPDQKKETGTLWEALLDTTLSSKPYLLNNHKTKAKDVFVQDDANKIYLISNTGKIIWIKQLHEKIISDVLQIDALKNNKLQILFNTRNNIYLFDRNGDDLKGFPIKLKSPATNSLSVIDYENNKEYRLFIATENKKIICYKPTGEQVSGFKFGKTDNAVSVPVKYFRAGNKDNLCAIDMKGKVYIIDRHGDTRVKLKEQMPGGISNYFIEPGKDYAATTIISSDTLGNIIKINLGGDKESIKLQSFQTSPYFDYKDLNNDNKMEYIFLTRNELKVFSDDKSLLFKYDFKDTINSAPQFFLFPDGTGKIGIVSEKANEIYLFYENGSLYNGFPLTGKTFFSIGDINNEGSYTIVTGSADKRIYVYQLH